MGTTTSTDRRSFLKTTALVAAPLAAVAAPVAALAGDSHAARLARIEDERAIEALHRAFLRDPRGLRGLAGTGETVRMLAADPDAGPEPIAFSDDGLSATAQRACSAQVAVEFGGETTLEQMARLQGNAADVHSKRCVIVAHYRKQGGEWALASAKVA